MWSNKKSLKVVVPQKLAFCPPYCPNPECPWHDPKEKSSFERHGKIKIKRYPYVSPRLRCLLCRRAFASSFFSLSYRDRTNSTYEEILDLRAGGFSRRQIAKFLGCDLDTVQRRIAKMSRQGLLIIAQDTANIKIKESVAYDGIQNFSYSQYDPNNINHVVGRDSFFVYDFNFCHLNRQGRMRPGQKKKKLALEEIHGLYPSRAIEECSKRIFERILNLSDGPLILHTDNHFMYRDALVKIKSKKKIRHEITQSRKARNFQNPLFPINHLDMLTRHHLASFKRETIAFAKTSQGMVEDFILLAVYKNYMRPKFVKKHKRDATTNKESPAMKLVLRKKIQSFSEVFRTRLTKHQVRLNEDWLMFFERRDPHSRRPIRAYSGI